MLSELRLFSAAPFRLGHRYNLNWAVNIRPEVIYFMRTLLILAVLSAAIGCASCTSFRTESVPISRAEQVPANRLLAYTEWKEGYARIVVTRDAGNLDGACFIGLVVAGTLAARFDTKETAEFFMPAGESDMAVVRDPQGRGLCAIGAWEPVPEHYVLKADRPNLFRISLRLYRRPRLIPAVY
jgi:hypothetical protein